MIISLRNLCYVLFFLFSLSCKKEAIIDSEDHFINESEQLSGLELVTSAIGQNFIEVSWTKVHSTRFEELTYSVIINNEPVVRDLKVNKYSFIHLSPGQEYTIKVIASSKSGLESGQEVKIQTLPLQIDDNVSTQVFYKEYKIHSYSTISHPIGLKIFSDGGHLIVSHLHHPSDFPKDSYKLLVFRIDKEGNMMWYRILPMLGHAISSMSKSNIILYNDEREGIVFTGNYAIKVSTDNGDILLEKDFREIDTYDITSLFYKSSQQLIVGTGKGLLMSLDPTDLSVKWQQNNQNELGRTVAITMDDKANIYAVYFNSSTGPMRIRKYDSQGNHTYSYNLISGDFYTGSLIINNENNLIFITSNPDSYYNVVNYFMYDEGGTLIKQNVLTGKVSSARALLNNKGDIVVYGTVDGDRFVSNGGILTFDSEMNIKSQVYYTKLPYHILGGITLNTDGSYNLFLHYMQTYTFENFNLIHTRTDANGNI